MQNEERFFENSVGKVGKVISQEQQHTERIFLSTKMMSTS